MNCHRILSFGMIAILSLVSVVLSRAPAQDKEDPIAAEVKKSLKNPAKPFTMIVRLQVKKGSEKAFEQAFSKAIGPTLKEKGNLAYQLNRDTKTTTLYLLYEKWQNLDALKAHLKTKHITTLLKQVGEMLAGPPAVQVLIPTGK